MRLRAANGTRGGMASRQPYDRSRPVRRGHDVPRARVGERTGSLVASVDVTRVEGCHD